MFGVSPKTSSSTPSTADGGAERDQARQAEPLQVLRYRSGGEYKPHMDAIRAEPNQRILTVLVYLSDDYEGGETQFPRTGLSFRGRTGDALLFRNADSDGRPDPLTLHAGLPVTRGTKYLASRWIRAEKFTYPPPQPCACSAGSGRVRAAPPLPLRGSWEMVR